MNKQKTKTGRGIEWCDYTWNPIGGCIHDCRWIMPDGTIAECYAKSTAEAFRSDVFFPQGFAAHYWHPKRLGEPKTLKTPARIFIDSMSDIGAHNVPEDQRQEVFRTIGECPQHTFIMLTKNAPFLIGRQDALPRNLWIGVSSPPDFMFGRALSEDQRIKMFLRSVAILSGFENHITFVSAEPLTFDVAEVFERYPKPPIDWLIIGAASRGARHFQPEKQLVINAVSWAERNNIPLFFKGNLLWSFVKEEFPPERKVTE